MKKFRVICLLLAFITLLSSVPATSVRAETEPSSEETMPAPTQGSVPSYETDGGDSSVTSGCHSINAQMPLWGKERLLDTAGAAMLYERNSDTMVYSWNADMTLYPASLVKIMTCLVALENSDLSEMVTVTSTAVGSLPKGTTLNFVVGETWTMEEMLYCLMVGGYNDAAVVIAEHVAGSQPDFVRLMNQRAAEIGCVGTVFTNTTGFHDNEQISTTRDLVKILIEALKHEHFTKFFNETIFRLPANDLHKARYMETTNYMMTQTITQEYYDKRITGGRTGVTELRERCLIVTAESGGLSYIGIVMLAKATYDDEGKIIRFGSYEEMKELIKKGFDQHRITQVLGENQILTQYPVANGENSVTVGPAGTFYSVLPSNILSSELYYSYQHTPSLTAPVKTGEYVTSVQVWYKGVCLAQTALVTRNSSDITTVADQSVYIEKTGEGLRSFLRMLGILAVTILSIGGIYFLVIAWRRAALRAQHRRRRKNRRRSR